MDLRKNKLLHRLLSELKLMDMKADLIYQATDGRTTSSREMSNMEVNILINRLNQDREERVGKMRGKIIYYLTLYGMSNNGKPDYNSINKYIRNIGSNNPRRKYLYNLSPKEMRLCLNQVEAMYKKELTKKS